MVIDWIQDVNEAVQGDDISSQLLVSAHSLEEKIKADGLTVVDAMIIKQEEMMANGRHLPASLGYKVKVRSSGGDTEWYGDFVLYPLTSPITVGNGA